MVRTSDFHFENVGSNPASPTTLIKNKNSHQTWENIEPFFFKNLTFQKNQKEYIRYTVNFISIVSPISFKKTSFHEDHRKNLSKINNKSFFKRSYTALTWFYYLTFVNLKKNKKNNISVFIKPRLKKIFTNVKAPMAHKNNSKEQYMFSFYAYAITFKNELSDATNLNNKSVFKNFLFLWATKKNLFFLETNALFLKSYKFYSNFSDKNFFKFK